MEGFPDRDLKAGFSAPSYPPLPERNTVHGVFVTI